MELRELVTFREVAKHSSFNLAAARLGYAQSTVSAQIQSLENDLGVRLFDRLGRSIAITAAGEALLPFAQRLHELVDAARSAVDLVVSNAGALVGTVSLSAPESLLTYRLPAVFTAFRDRHPGVTIDVHPTPIGRFRGDTRVAVANGSVHVAFVLDSPLDTKGFTSEIIRHESVDVIAPPEHPIAAKRRVRPADLDGASILYPEAPDSGCIYRRQFESHMADVHATPSSAIEFTSIETVKQCVASGMGISALLTVAVDTDIAAGRLARLNWSEPFDLYTQMVWNARSSLSPALSAFMATARELLAG